jgi:hypothetical protein
MLTCVREWLDVPIPSREGEWCPRVLYFTEEGKRTWSRRVKRLPGDPDALAALDVVPALGMSLKQMMADVHSYSGPVEDWNPNATGEAVGYDVVVIDTLRSLLGVEDENDSAEIARAVQPWVELSQRTGVTVVILHHTRKGGGKYGEGVSGGHGLIGALDIILELNRDGDGNRRVVEVMGREVEPVKGVYERAEIQTAHDMGTGRFELRFVGDRKSVVERVKPLLLADEWRTTADIRADLDPQPTKDAVTDALVKLCREGYAVREPAIGKDAERKTVFWQRA